MAPSWDLIKPIRVRQCQRLALCIQRGACASSERGTTFVDAVAKAYEAGLNIDFTGLFAGESRRRVSIPGYPFQRRRHWVDEPSCKILAVTPHVPGHSHS